MISLVRSKIFALVFFGSYITFVAVTMYIYDFVKEGVGVGHTVHGFPFAYYYSHCFGGYYLWIGFVGNLAVAALISFLSGIALSHLHRTISSPEFRAKWYL
jgi:hypothetical protein